MTLNININDIPDFLKLSELYDSLSKLGNESFEIPEQYYKNNLTITCFKDILYYIKVFDYWMINYIPDEFYDWIYQNKDEIKIDLLNDQFPMNYLTKQIKDIISIPLSSQCDYFSCIGDLRLLKYTHKNGCSMNKKTCID